MELTGVGGGLMLAIAAGLWLVYLVPNWFKRREYLATERNAVRLQQTIRVLAETAEVPAAVRAEAAARQVALQQRAEFRQGPVSVGRPVQKVQPSAAQVAEAGRRMRRTRAATTLVLIASLITAVVQITTASWVMLAISGAAVIGSLALLARIAEVSRSRTAPVVARADRRTSLGRRPVEAPVVQRQAEWTPVPVPKPMYLSRTVVEAAAAVQDPAVELKAAAAASELALRNAEHEVTPLRPAAASGSRFASMGIVDESAIGTTDIDAVLARRRA